MTVATRNPHLRGIPESVARPLRRIAIRQRAISTALASIRSLLLILGLVVPISLILGTIHGPSVAARIVVASGAWLAIAIGALICMRRALKRHGMLSVARFVERHVSGVNERLSSVIQLAAEDDSPFAPSAALREQLLREAEAQANRLNVRGLAPARPLLPWSLGLFTAVFGTAVLFAIPDTRRVASAGVYKLVVPWRSTLPDALAEIAVEPGDATLVEGDALDVVARASAEHAQLVEAIEDGPRQTREMSNSDKSSWRTTIANVRQNFRYQIATDTDHSRWFSVIVRPRPALTSLTLRYEYPAYTDLPPRTVTGLDGTIDAVVGTRVTMTARTSEPLDLAASALVAGGAAPLSRVANDDAYQSSLVVTRDGEYTFKLVNKAGFSSRAMPPRKIVAHPDQVPSIIIQSPDSEVSVRPDDMIPVQFLAGDDFGISRIDVLVRTNGVDVPMIPVEFDTSDRRHVTGPDVQLRVRDLIKSADDRVIRYQLRATDNRTPAPQSAVSAEQSLQVNPDQTTSYQGAMDRKLGRGLDDVIRNTIRELERARPRLTQSKTRDGSEPLGEWQRKELRQAAIDLPDVRERLSRAVEQASGSVFRPVAQILRPIADGPLRTAAEQAGRANLDPDDWRERNDAIIKATSSIDEAREALQKILDANVIENCRGAAEAARDLAAASSAQRDAAELLRPGERQRAAERQRVAADRLRQALAEHPSLADEAAKNLAQKLQELIRKLASMRAQDANAAEATRESESLATAAREAKNDDVEGRAARAAKWLSDVNANDHQKLDEALAAAERELRSPDRSDEERAGQDPAGQAARDAQEAAQAQREASTEQSPAAAGQAAAALQRAASAMARAAAKSAPGFSEDSSGPAVANAPSAAQTGSPGAGGPVGPPPAAIRDLGISPETWARLPPLARRDLLGAAQQSGPPAYREMIRDYYVKLSQMHSMDVTR